LLEQPYVSKKIFKFPKLAIIMPELLDVVDENDNVIGQEERDVCLAKNLLHRSVHVFVFNSKGELLLQKRSMKKKIFPGRWCASCSGHVSAGQTYEEAAVRELEEEIGVSVENLKFVAKFFDLNPVDSEIAKLYTTSHEGPFKIQEEEVDEVKFLPMEKIKEEIKNSPEKYTSDFALALSVFLNSSAAKSSMPEMIILVDENDKEIGAEEKVRAHENGGKLHRSFSIFVFNSRGEMLLQLRAKKKYHFGGLWSNTCCSHPNAGESLESAVHRKLKQEMGFDAELKEAFSFIYKVEDKNSGLTEWEFDHVFIGKHDGEVPLNPEEADDFKFVSVPELKQDVEKNPEKYTLWFRTALPKVLEKI